jgi:diguanylate cyclase (GGDEF)-like protein
MRRNEGGGATATCASEHPERAPAGSLGPTMQMLKTDAGVQRRLAAAFPVVACVLAAFAGMCITIVFDIQELRLVSATGLAILLVATYFRIDIARRFTRPIRELTGYVDRIAAHDFSARVDIPSGPIGELGVSFNRMAERLSAGHAAVLEYKRELEERVSERTRELSDSYALLLNEVRQTQLAAERAEHLAYYDSLTGLPNRVMFSKLLTQALSLARRNTRQLAILFVDLDRFKNINDTLGHEVGDLLLQEVGLRLQGCLRESDTVARMGGDEFVILLADLRDTSYLAVVANKILAATSESFEALGHEFRVTASVGISIYPLDGDDEQVLMKNADIAMYQAKDDGRNNFRAYSMRLNPHSFEVLALESSLRRALDNDEFQLHYQPKYSAASGGIVGTEALIRWRHPELGMLPPTKFIAVAEETGLIVAIGKWVLKTACAQNMAWQRKGLPPLNMAVNLSGRQFADHDLLQDITAILKDSGMDPRLLELEITESTLMHDVDRAMGTLASFRDLGLRLAIDDFGTGYSSLSTLTRFPIDTIKIDGSFVRDLSKDRQNRCVAEAIIAMGRSLNLNVIAEGVETKAQADFLRERSCDEFQGFYFSQGVPASRLEALLVEQTATAGRLAAVGP